MEIVDILDVEVTQHVQSADGRTRQVDDIIVVGVVAGYASFGAGASLSRRFFGARTRQNRNIRIRRLMIIVDSADC
ncbi:MAG: hypothetical protein Athens041674_596 [Parcubacteria group bacterium Athens0416_74]|nr:MAG: hypothetical protein Athens041674_596 [Parcubacteria group bacterium Athens0416_74]